MILLQEVDQTVTFQPMYIDGPSPWYERLFLLYLLVVLFVLLVSGVRLVVGLRRLRRIGNGSLGASTSADDLWNALNSQAQSLSKFSLLTFFLSLLAWRVADFADKLPVFTFGMLVCVALYIVGRFFESRLNRWTASFERLRDTSSTN